MAGGTENTSTIIIMGVTVALMEDMAEIMAGDSVAEDTVVAMEAMAVVGAVLALRARRPVPSVLDKIKKKRRHFLITELLKLIYVETKFCNNKYLVIPFTTLYIKEL